MTQAELHTRGRSPAVLGAPARVRVRPAAHEDRQAIDVRWIGRMEYGQALGMQRALQVGRIEGRICDTILLLEHPEVITLGRSAQSKHLLRSEAQLRSAGIALERTNRGGDITYHGPGQLVGYPILDLAAPRRRAGGAARPDVHRYLRALESVLIRVLGRFGLVGTRVEGRSGVWLDDDCKIASIGIGVRRWVTLHGFALNVSTALERFEWIVPCGLRGVRMTSMEQVLGRSVPVEAVRIALEEELRAEFE